MTDQPEFDRLLVAYFVEGSNELADRVIDAALDQIVHTRQRRPLRVPRRSPTITMPFRLAAAAVIGVLAVGGAFYLLQPNQPAVGGPGPTPSASLGSSQAVTTTAPTPATTPAEKPAATTAVQSLTGPMGVGRQVHTATALADGRVLVAGGYDNKDGALASAVLYDPATAAFHQTSSLASARGYQTATLLSDGRVLIAGGGAAVWPGVITAPPADGAFLSSAELYDPKTGTFSPTGSLATPRETHTATLLDDGRVLIAGGNDTSDHGVATAELYDPKTGTFSPTGSMTTSRAFHTATLLSDGRVLIIGGGRAAWTGDVLDTAEIYDPKSGTFSMTGAMPETRVFHTATLLADGRVLITGGSNGSEADIASAVLYDPKTGTFDWTGSMADGRQYHTATLLNDGRVLVAGGGADYTNRQFIASAEIYDPRTSVFTATGSMTDVRTYHAAALLTDGRVIVTGGYGPQAPLASAETYDPKTGTFSPAGSGG
jgi:hypothetical protein